MKKLRIHIVLLALIPLFFGVSCIKRDAEPEVKLVDGTVPNDFDYEMLYRVPLTITFLYGEHPMKNQSFGLYTDSNASDRILQGISDESGQYDRDLVVFTKTTELFLRLAGETEEGLTRIIRLDLTRGSDYVLYFPAENLTVGAVSIDRDLGKIKWRVRNPYDRTIRCDWSFSNRAENGVYDAPLGDSYFETNWYDDCSTCSGESAGNTISLQFTLDGVETTLQESSMCACDESPFEYAWPSQVRTVSVGFEDFWPSTGDFDMNDVVVNMRYVIDYGHEDGVEYARKIKLQYKLKYSGAGFHNGFGIQFPFEPGMIRDVSGTIVNDVVNIQYAANGTEAGQSQAVIILFEDTRDLREQFNANDPVYPHEVVVEFEDGVTLESLTDYYPLNPFIFNGLQLEHPEVGTVGARKIEIHLPQFPPTDLVDFSLFGEGEENGEPYYLTNPGNYPWAMLIPLSFKFPREKINITEAYPLFEAWVLSGGVSNQDWYNFPDEELVIDND